MKRLKIIAFSLLLVFLSMVGYIMYLLIPSGTIEDNIDSKDSLYSQMSDKVKSTVEEIIPMAPKLELRQKEPGDEVIQEEQLDYILLLGEGQHGKLGLFSELDLVIGIDPENYQLEVIDLSKEGISLKELRKQVDSDKEQLKKMVEAELGVGVKNYIKVSEGILPELIDAVGGITINADSREHAQEIHLNGKETVDFIQEANLKSEENAEQLSRQMLVTDALVEKLTSSVSIGLATSLLSVMDRNVETDMGLTDILSTFMTYARHASELKVMPVSGMGTSIEEE